MRGRYKFFLILGEDLADVLRHQVRYEMHWGHKTLSKDGQVDVTRAEYNEGFGVETPEAPDIPDAGLHIWEWWWKLNSRRVTYSEVQAPLTYSEIYHWSILTRTQISPSEIDVLMIMDDAYLGAVADERKDQRARNKGT